MTSSTKHIGRFEFVLRILVFSTLAFVLEYLFRGDALLHLNVLPRYLHTFERVIVFGLAGIYLVEAIDGRLLDAGLPRWYRYPAFAVWLVSTSIPMIWIHEWPIGLALFALLLIAGGSIPGKTVPVKLASASKSAESEEKASASAPMPIQKSLARLLVGPVGFLRSVLTIGCLWLPLICLEDMSGRGAGVWIARFGYFILCVVWLIKVLGRLEDAGRTPYMRPGYFIIGVLLLSRMLRRLGSAGRSSQWYGFSFSYAVSMLSLWFKYINGYETLALFLLIQVPLAFLPSKCNAAKTVSENDSAEEGVKKPIPIVRTNELSLSGPFEYLRILFVIACLWIPLIYIDDASGGSVGSWIARLGYLILGFFWLTFANGRLEDAGWAHSQYPAQYGLVVSVASLMPLAVRWVNGYEALAIFVLIQTPTAFLRSKPAPEEPLPESGGSEEADECLRDPLGGILVRRTNEDGVAYPERKPAVLTGSGFGRAKRVPRWRRF